MSWLSTRRMCPLSSLSTRRMCRQLGECIPPSPQSTRTAKPSQIPVSLLPMIRGRRRENQQHIQSLCRSCQPGGCAVQPGECIPLPPQSSRTPKRHKSRLLASHDEWAPTIEPAAYPVPLSSLSTRRMWSTTGRVYCSATTKLEDHRNVTSPVCLHPMIRRRRRGNMQLIHSICQSEHPRLLPSSMYYPLHRVL